MNFLYPGFLFSLLAVAIPILIHLFNFRKYKTVYFSNVQFLKAAQEQNSSREKLRNLLILCSRILAVIFLVLAFARPYLSSGSGNHPENNNLINIYIDNSYSMEAVSKEGTLLDEAKRRAKEIARLSLPNDRFQLTTNDFEGRHQRLVNREELINLVDEIKISPVQRSLQQVINRQQAADAGKRNLHSYILSDFQLAFAGTLPIHSSPGNQLSLIRLYANSLPNIAVDSVWSLSPVHKPGDQEKFVVRLHNYAEKAGMGIALKLTVNQQQRALARLNVPAGKSVLDTLSFSGLTAGWQTASVSIRDYPLTFDDELLFAFEVSKGLDILQISGDAAEKHINALFAGDPYFRLRTMPETAIDYSAFSRYSMIVLSGLKTPSSGLAQQLLNYTKNGGTAVVFPDTKVNMADFSVFLAGLSLPAAVSLNQDSMKVSSIDLAHQLFQDVFEEMPAKPDLPLVKRYFTYATTNSRDREDLMKLPGGRIFFSRYRSGAGHIYLSAVSLQNGDSNFPEHPIFVPLLYKIAFTSGQELPLYYTTGKNNLLAAGQMRLNPSESLRLISGKKEVIPEIRQVPGKTLLYIADQIRASGFYELRKQDSLSNIYAFNESRAESDMHYKSEKDLQNLFGTQKIFITDSKRALSAATVENNRTELWKLCLVLCAVFLAVEALLIRFFNLLKI